MDGHPRRIACLLGEWADGGRSGLCAIRDRGVCGVDWNGMEGAFSLICESEGRSADDAPGTRTDERQFSFL